MFDLFRETSYGCSRLITENYSTSFTLGIKTLDKSLHEPIFGIYGFVRYADEIVDTFHEHDKAYLLAKFKADTYEAIEQGISLNPVLQSYQEVVNKFNIDNELTEAFFKSMEMDLDKCSYGEECYSEYIYGSAEVVGLMCLKVFVNGNKEKYDALKSSARSLGAAFQKVNFLRDMKSDFEDRGRVYFPGIDFDYFDDEQKLQVEKDIRKDFDDAYDGIIRLPIKARMGVYLAYRYYRSLFKRIQKAPAEKIQEVRVRVPDRQKLLILAGTLFRSYLRVI